MSLEIKTSYMGGKIIIRVTGDLAYPHTEKLLTTVKDVIFDDCESIQLKLDQIDEISSNCVYAFLEAWELCRKSEITFTISSRSPKVRDFLETTQLDRFMQILY